MSDSRTVPGPAADNNDRILERPADDFAGLPEDETHPVEAPGDGPRGGLDAGVQLPTVLVVAGMAVAFATFLAGTPILLAVGALLVVVGLVMGALRSRVGPKKLGTAHLNR